MSKTRDLARDVVYAALTALKENGGELPVASVLAEVEKRANLSPYALEKYKSGNSVRWVTVLRYYSIDCSKAGLLLKKSGIWYLTPEGEAARQLGPEHLLKQAVDGYRQWKKQNSGDETGVIPDNLEKSEQVEPEQQARLQSEQIEELAIQGIKTYLDLRGAYEFQDIVAALLRAMGYHTPFVAPKGKDGGVDILAYRDPLGIVPPRIKVQVKHRTAPASVQEVRELLGLLQGDGDVGIFLSTGGFTSDAKRTARESRMHLELIDAERFIDLWQEFHDRIDEEGKRLLPLKRLYVLATDE